MYLLARLYSSLQNVSFYLTRKGKSFRLSYMPHMNVTGWEYLRLKMPDVGRAETQRPLEAGDLLEWVGELANKGDAERFQLAMDRAVDGQRFFRTGGGYVGLGPAVSDERIPRGGSAWGLSAVHTQATLGTVGSCRRVLC